MSKKMVLKVELSCDKCKQKAMKTVASIRGVESVQIDMKDQKITVIGDADPVCITNKLRKFGLSELESVGPAKEPEKKQPEKKEAPKKDEKKEAPKKDEKKEAPEKEEKKDAPKKEVKKDVPREEKKETPMINSVANITYVYLPRHCEPCCGGYCYYHCRY